MATSNSMATGTLSWTEIPCTDLDRIKAFYSSVFGWTATCSSPHAEVSLFEKDSTHGSFVKVAAENHLSPAKHPDNPGKGRMAVRVTISVDSIGDTLKEIEKAGGALYMPTKEIPGNMGFVAYFTDTEKNVMGIWSMKE